MSYIFTNVNVRQIENKINLKEKQRMMVKIIYQDLHQKLFQIVKVKQ